MEVLICSQTSTVSHHPASRPHVSYILRQAQAPVRLPIISFLPDFVTFSQIQPILPATSAGRGTRAKFIVKAYLSTTWLGADFGKMQVSSVVPQMIHRLFA